MQQINSPYRGDSSDNLASIMGMQYAPQNQLNKFTGDMAMAGLQGMGATSRLSMQLGSQQMMDTNRLREQARATNLQYMLGDRNASVAEGRLGMEMAGQQFGQQKDVAQFFANKANQEGMLGVSQKNAETQRMVALDPAKARIRTELGTEKDALSSWSVWDQEAKIVSDEIERKLKEAEGAVIPQFGTTEEIAAGKRILENRRKYRFMKDSFSKRVDWARNQYNTQGSSFLTPFFKSPLGNTMQLRQLAELGYTPEEEKPAAVPRY